MAFTKIATLEDAEVLDVKGASSQQHTASLDKLGDFENYRTGDGYIYARIRAISSRVNKNYDGWPSVELAGSPEIFERHHSGSGFTVEAGDGNNEFGFATFLGKPIFVDHHNSDPKKSRGVVRDAKLRVLDHRTATMKDSYWGGHDVDREHLPPTEIELLLEIDAKSFPRLAKAIVNGDIDGFSMGCNVQRTKCSHCGNIAEAPDEFCAHIVSKGAQHDFKTADGQKVSKKSYENCYGCQFFELSNVFDPADPTALAREVISKEMRSVLETGQPGALEEINHDPIRNDSEIADIAMSYQMKGIDPQAAMNLAQHQWDRMHKTPGAGEGESYQPKMMDYTPSDMQGMPLSPEHESVLPPPRRPEESGGNTEFAGEAGNLLDEQYPKRPTMNDPRWSKTAENDLPQEFQTRAPDNVDTLRDEEVCPICGSDMDSETCDVCGYVRPPKEFDNPDLTKSIQIRERMKNLEEQQSNGQASGGGQGPLTSQMPNKSGPTASIKSDMRWTPRVHPKTAARINQVEKPVSTAPRPATNEPQNEVVLKDQHKPVTSAMHTAQQLIANANRKGRNSMSTRTADGPTPPGDTSSDARVDVMGVGGVLDGSNEQASKADGQTDVLGKGGTGVSDVSADKSESLPTAGEKTDDSGYNKDKTTEDSGPTSTFPDSDGTEKGVTDPVTDKTLEEQDQQGGSKGPVSSYRQAYDDQTLEQNEQQGDPVAQGGSAVQGVQPADPVATDSYKRVNVLEHTTSPDANNSGPTKTWSGTDGNSVLRQADPTTKQIPETGGVPTPDVKLHNAKAHMLAALRLTEVEQDLGLVSREEKWDRLAALDEQSSEEIKAQLDALSRVKTAGLAKLAQQRQAGVRVPKGLSKNFERIASGPQTAKESSVTDESIDSALFMK